MSVVNEKRASGAAIASRLTMSDMAVASARSDFKNLSRAGVAAKRSRASTRAPSGAAQGSIAPLIPSSTTSFKPVGAPPMRVRISSRDTEAIEGSASPRKPKVAIAARSPSGIFDVACRSTLRARSASSMPRPSSATRMSLRPPALIATSILFAAGVERVLDQFLHRRSRPLDHFACGDAVDEQRIETANWHGAKTSPRLSHWRGSGGSGPPRPRLNGARRRVATRRFRRRLPQSAFDVPTLLALTRTGAGATLAPDRGGRPADAFDLRVRVFVALLRSWTGPSCPSL